MSSDALTRWCRSALWLCAFAALALQGTVGAAGLGLVVVVPGLLLGAGHRVARLLAAGVLALGLAVLVQLLPLAGACAAGVLAALGLGCLRPRWLVLLAAAAATIGLPSLLLALGGDLEPPSVGSLARALAGVALCLAAYAVEHVEASRVSPSRAIAAGGVLVAALVARAVHLGAGAPLGLPAVLHGHRVTWEAAHLGMQATVVNTLHRELCALRAAGLSDEEFELIGWAQLLAPETYTSPACALARAVALRPRSDKRAKKICARALKRYGAGELGQAAAQLDVEARAWLVQWALERDDTAVLEKLKSGAGEAPAQARDCACRR